MLFLLPIWFLSFSILVLYSLAYQKSIRKINDIDCRPRAWKIRIVQTLMKVNFNVCLCISVSLKAQRVGFSTI